MRFSCYNNLTCPILLASIWFDIKSISVFVPNAWRIKKEIEYGDWMKEGKRYGLSGWKRFRSRAMSFLICVKEILLYINFHCWIIRLICLSFHSLCYIKKYHFLFKVVSKDELRMTLVVQSTYLKILLIMKSIANLIFLFTIIRHLKVFSSLTLIKQLHLISLVGNKEKTVFINHLCFHRLFP